VQVFNYSLFRQGLKMLFRAKKDIVGLDIGSSSVKLVKLREAKGIYHLESLGMAALPPEAIVDNAIMDSTSVVEVIRNLVESHQVKTKNVATSISGHSVIIRKINLPIMTEEEMESTIQWEAEQYIPFDVSEVNLDFQILGHDEKDPSQMSVVLVAAKKDFVDDNVAVLKECGLTPVVIDVDCFAIENAFEANHGGGNGTVALVNMGASSTNINILKEGVSVFTRDIQVGGNMFNDEIQKRLGLSGAEAEKVKLGEEHEGVEPQKLEEVIAQSTDVMAQEVQRSLDFFSATSSDEKVQSLFITGGVSKASGVKVALEERLGIPVTLLDPFRELVVSEKEFDPEYLQEMAPFFSVAVGLAMRRLGDK
jgi:type IV pilus assembly protein PilM